MENESDIEAIEQVPQAGSAAAVATNKAQAA
jgi:hypothetical protein